MAKSETKHNHLATFNKVQSKSLKHMVEKLLKKVAEKYLRCCCCFISRLTVLEMYCFILLRSEVLNNNNDQFTFVKQSHFKENQTITIKLYL